MGLAATQVRLLQLTSRQHRIEYQAQRIQAQKLQLSNESDAAYNAYMTALDSKKIQYKYIEKDGSITYKDATFNNMFGGYKAGVQNLYALERVKTGTLIVKADIKNNFDAHSTNKDEFVKACSNDSTDESEKAYYQNLFDLLSSYGKDKLEPMVAGYADSSEWLTNMIANGDVMLHKWETEGGDDGKGAWTEVAVATDTMLSEVANEKELKKAEATYEAETTRINRKDSQYDTMLSQTETERSAIKTEIDSLKTVRSDNIDKTFKLFS